MISRTRSDSIHACRRLPARVTAGRSLLKMRNDLKEEGYTLQPLPGGDCLLRVRHLRSGEVSIKAS